MLQLRQITKQYIDDKNENVCAIKNVDLKFPKQGLVVINGPSGCGKTTLLNIIGGLDNPTSGEVYINDVRIDNKDETWWDEFRGSGIGFIYQDFNLLENMTVRDNIKLPLALQDIDEKTALDKIVEVAKELDISDYMDKKAAKISGGQKQRVAIARVLVTGSKIILADEPTGNLDRENSDNVFKLLKKIAKKRLVIVVTHDTVLANLYADRLINIAYGEIENDKIIENSVALSNGNADLETNEKSFFDNQKNKISFKECFRFAIQTMKQRKLRCVISVFIFSITMLFILVLSEVLFRKDSIPITEFINERHQKIIPLFMEVPQEYINVVSDGKITEGREFCDLVYESVNKGQVIRCGSRCNIQYDDDTFFEAGKIFISKDNEKNFLYKGVLPQNKNEVAISALEFGQDVIKQNINDGILGTKILINKNEYTVTAVVTHICGKSVKDLYVDDGMGYNLLSNVVYFNDEVLANDNIALSLYMPGFGGVVLSDLLHQVTVYNKILEVDNQTELILGRRPEKDNEILVSEELYNLKKDLNEDILGKKYKLYDLRDDRYKNAYWNIINLFDYMGREFVIVGVAKGNADFYILPSIYEEIYEEYKIYYENKIYLLANKETIKKDIETLMKSDVKIDNSELDKVYAFINDVDGVKFGLIVIGFILSLLTVLQMISLYSYSINDSKKTIGILRTIGVNKADTIRIFIIECIVISTISFVIALIFSFLMTYLINNFICSKIIEIERFNFLRMRLGIIIVAGCINCMLSTLSVLVPIRKYSKMKVIELIK